MLACLEDLYPVVAQLRSPNRGWGQSHASHTVPALESSCDGLGLSASPAVLVPPQVYRNSVIAQWRALDLDVLLTPMLGPAMDLNAPGKASGEAHFPTHPFSSQFSPVPSRAAGK